MFPRCFVIFGILALFAVVTQITAKVVLDEEDDALDEEDEDRQWGLLIGPAIKALEIGFRKASRDCIKNAAGQCKGDWKNPKKLYSCARGYFKQHNCKF